MIKRVFSFRTDMEAWRSAKVVKISGLVVLAFAILALLSSVSYLFTWEADQSLLSTPDRMSQNVDVHNAAGKAGAGLGYLMICRWFGLGSFAFVLALFILAVRMLFGHFLLSRLFCYH